MEYYFTFKRNEILIYTITWIKLEDVLIEISQTKKTNIV